MLIDDTVIDQFIAKQVLLAANFSEELNIYSCPFEALETLKSENASFPDIIFLDLQMPVQSGLDFLEDFKNLPCSQTSQIKIVMMTSSNNPDDFAKIDECGMVSRLLPKPLTIDMVRNLKKEFADQLSPF